MRSDAEAERARGRWWASPTGAAPSRATPAGSTPAGATPTVVVTVPAAAVPAVKLHMLDRVPRSLRRRSGVSGTGESDGRKAKRSR
jgi:hypothetical protein